MTTGTRRSRPPAIVRIARALRHSRALREKIGLWRLLRPAYQAMLPLFSPKRGLKVEIEGIGAFSVPVSFLGGEVDELEIPMLRRMAAVLESTSCFYDIGASIGLHSLVAGERLGLGSEIHAFEPDLPSCARYWENVSLLRRRFPVLLSRCFVTDKSASNIRIDQLFPKEVAEQADNTTHAPAKHLYLFENAEFGSQTQPVKIALDDYVCEGARPPTVLKCDIEGAELLFLRGARETIRRYRPLLFISLHPQLIGKFGFSESEIFEYLVAANYEWTVLNEVGETHLFAIHRTERECRRRQLAPRGNS